MLKDPVIARSLLVMQPKVFHFYLPSFMMAALDSPGCDWAGAGAMIFALAPPIPKESGPWVAPDEIEKRKYSAEKAFERHAERMGLLSLAQRKAVIEFLAYL